MRLPDPVGAPRTRRRDKLGPDPTVHREILSAASSNSRESREFADSASPRFLERATLGTRAFYRHFDSKDELVAALFLEMARVEERRLRRRMAAASHGDRRGGGVDRRATRLGIRRQHQIRFAPCVAGSSIADVRLPQPGPARVRRNAQAAQRSSLSAACSTGCSITSIRWPTHKPSTPWCGRASSGNGRPAIVTARTSANARSDSACAGWA